MPRLESFHVVWVTGPSCDGCTIAVVGDTTVAPIEALLTGAVPGLPRVVLHHPVLALEQGAEYMANLERAAQGHLDPFALVVEASIPGKLPKGSFAWMQEREGRFVDVADWVERLAARAAVVIAIGDCAVWGGPHSEDPDPVRAKGVGSLLGVEYRSSLGLPVVNLPGCCVPPVFIATVAAVLRWAQGDGPLPELDAVGRPVFAYTS